MPIYSYQENPYLGEVTVGSGSLLIGSVTTVGGTVTNSTNIINSAGWVVAISNTTGWIEARPGTATRTQVAGSNGSLTLLAANTARRMAMIYNDVTVGSSLYLTFGAAATTADFTIQLYGKEYYELPFPVFTGVINGIWESSAGVARVTELT